MLPIEKLNELKDESNAAISAMEARIEKLNALIAHHEKDGTRSREYVLENVKAERDKALPELGASLKIVQTIHKEAASQKRFWESRALLMSLQAFRVDPAKNATIKTFWRADLAQVPAALLQLAYVDARFGGNLPLLWQVFSTGQARSVADRTVASALDMTLDGLELPDQAAALAAISTCWSNVDHGEMIFSVAAALRIDPVRKMNVARQQQVTNKLVTAASGIEGRFIA